MSEVIRKADQGEEVLISRRGRTVAKVVKAGPAKRILGGARDQIVEIDPDWWKPMSEEEIEDFYAGR